MNAGDPITVLDDARRLGLNVVAMQPDALASSLGDMLSSERRDVSPVVVHRLAKLAARRLFWHQIYRCPEESLQIQPGARALARREPARHENPRRSPHAQPP